MVKGLVISSIIIVIILIALGIYFFYPFSTSTFNCGDGKCNSESEIQICDKDCDNLTYDNCVSILNSEKAKYPSAESESVEATREDKDGNIWIKQEDGMWETDVKKWKGTRWGNSVIDELPGGINYQSDLSQCDKYKLKVGGCAKEGEEYSIVYDEYPANCCGGLTEWEAGFDTRYAIEDKCYESGLVSGNPVGICINCGNEICEDSEDICNCPEDCPNGENSVYTIESFCKNWESSNFKSGCDSGDIINYNTGEKLPICNLCK